MISQETLERVLKVALKKGGDFADIFAERKAGTAVRLEDRKVEEVVSGYDAGAGIRVVSGESTRYVFTDDLSEKGLLQAAEAVAEAVKAGAEQPLNTASPFKEEIPPVRHEVKIPPSDINRDRKVDVVLRADEKARSMGKEILQVTASYTDSVQDVLIANSEGRIAKDKRVLTRLFVHVIARRGDNVQTGFETPGLHAGFEFFDKNPPEKAAEIAAERALAMLDARAAPAGKMPVIVASGSGGVLFHEASGHGLEADAIQKGASVYAGRLGEKVASGKVSAADDPSLANRWGSFAFDDEGTPAKRNLLIDKGVLANYMYDRIRALKDKVPATSNGRRQSFRHVPVPRMTNTFILPGSDTFEEMLAATKRGLYAKALGGGEVNPATGDFVFGVSEGYLIEKGEIAYPVRGAVLVGNGPRILNLIDFVGRDLDFDAGMCGKDGQAVPVATGQPAIRISELTVGGTQQ
ncbi:MAG: TldD/PmbA family protein [Actinomycetota bacterium]